MSIALARTLVLTHIILLASTGHAADYSTEPVSDPLQQLHRKMPAMMDQAGIPGLAISVIKPGQPLWQRNYGLVKADTDTAVANDTVFQAASLSKPVFAYICLRLVDQGKLDLNQSLAEYLENPRIKTSARYLTITARHVLSHRSGLPNWGDDSLKIAFIPGQFFRYSGEGYGWLGLVLEKITGKTVEKLAQEEVFKPLNMINSSYIWQPSYETQAAWPHDDFKEPQTSRMKPEKAIPAASLHTTAEDYSKFIQAIFSGQGLSEASRNLMLQSQGNVAKSEEPSATEKAIHWALGWGLEQADTRNYFFHWGDNGTFKAFVMGDLASKQALVYFANSSAGLSILKPVLTAVFPTQHPVIAWLNYEAYDAPGRLERNKALQKIQAKAFAEALPLIEKALQQAPEDKELKQALTWCQQRVQVQKQPIEIDASTLASYAGSYGPRQIKHAADGLTYQREGRSAFKLIPLSQTRFALEGMFDFQLEVVTDANNQPVKLVGHYLNGNSDANHRDTHTN